MNTGIHDPSADPAVIDNSISVHIITDTDQMILVTRTEYTTRTDVEFSELNVGGFRNLFGTLVKPRRWDNRGQFYSWYQHYTIRNIKYDVIR